MTIRLGLRDNRTHFHPGETVEGAVLWEGADVPDLAEIRLLWFTRGKGTEDAAVVQTVPFPDPKAGDTRTFQLQLPEEPYSYNGRLISITWAVEFVLKPGNHFERVEIVMGPDANEVRISPNRSEV